MRKIFKDAIEIDLFVKLKNDFFSIIADDIFELIINDDHTVSTKTNLHTTDIQDFIKKQLNKSFSQIEKLIIENLSEFSMQEKFYYITKALNDFFAHSGETASEIYINFIEIHTKPNEQGLYPNLGFGEYYNSEPDFKNEFESQFSGFVKHYFDIKDNLYKSLVSLDQQFKDGRLTDESRLEVNEYILKQRPIFTLENDFKISQLNGKVQLSKLNKNQITVLFEYLCNNGVFLDFDQKSKAVIASILTGHSEQNLRTEGFAYKDQILSGKNSSKKNDPSYDLKVVRDLLETILSDLKQRIK